MMTQRKSSIPQATAAEADIIAAWHNDESLVACAQMLDMKPATLERAWRWLKRTGKLPDRSRRHRQNFKDDKDAVDNGCPSVHKLGRDPLGAKLAAKQR